MKIGDRVFYSSIIGMPPKDDKTYKITELGKMCGDGEDVAWLDGKSGCVSLKALMPATSTEYISVLEDANMDRN